MEVDKESQNTLPFQQADPYEELEDTENYLETQVHILQSETLALQTIRSMDLGRYPEFGGESAGPNTGRAGPVKRPAILGAFLGSLTVKRVPDTRLIEVQFDAGDPQLAAAIVNTHLQNFIEQNFRSRYDATTQASNWLASELEELRIKVEKSEDARIAYERANQIWTIDEKQNITTQKLGDVSKALTDAQNDLVQRQAYYQLAHAGNLDSMPQVQENTLISQLQVRVNEAENQYEDALSQFGPNYPKVQRLEKAKKEADDALARAKQTIVAVVDGQYKAARDRVDLLTETLNQQKSDTNDLSEKLVQYNILVHEAESNKQLYDGLLQKLKEASISAGLRSSNIRIVDPALAPSSPSRPQKGRNILMALVVGLIGGCLLYTSRCV